MFLLFDVIYRVNGLIIFVLGLRYINSIKDILVKFVVFCNKINGLVFVSLYMGGIGIIFVKIINGYDILIILFFD